MNDDVEERLSRLTPRGLRPELREKVLGAVAGELQVGPKGTEELVGNTLPTSDLRLRQPPPSPWLRLAATVVAASLLLGIVLNVWAGKASERRLAEIFGPPPISKGAMAIAKDVEKISDAETGQWVYSQFTPPRQPGDGAAANAKYCDEIKRLINQLQAASKDTYHETHQKDSKMGGDRTGRIGGDTSDCQRLVRLDYRYTA